MKVLRIPLDPYLGITITAAQVLAERKAYALFKETFPVDRLGDDVRQGCP